MVSLLLVTHRSIGQSLVDVARDTFGALPMPVSVIDVTPDMDTSSVRGRLQDTIDGIDEGDGILILVDIYGATPGNLAKPFVSDTVQLVYGLNLPMLFRVLNYATLPLIELVDKALSAGHDGVCSEKN